MGLVRAAEEKFGAGQGDEKYQWVCTMAKAAGIRICEADVLAAVRILRAYGESVSCDPEDMHVSMPGY